MTAASLPRPVGRQREVLYLPARAHTVVLGTAAGGKTTLAILRSLYLSDPSTHHGGRTLLVTFNRCLVTYMTHLAGAVRRPVDVRNYHHFARGYLSARNKLPWGSICGPNERLGFVAAAVNAARNSGARSAALDRPKEFFDEEFQWIRQHGIGSEQDYLDTERTGRSTRVRKAERAAAFDLYERYLEQGDALYAEFQRQLRTLLSNGPARPKRIEEALGLIPLQVRRWLERMEHGGEIERASRNPVTYALTRKTLL